MKIREYTMVSPEENKQLTITVRKDNKAYKSTYSVCLFSSVGDLNIRTTCPNRQYAKKEFIRLMKLYTRLTLAEILKIK